MVGEEKCSFVVKYLGDSDQSAVSSENLYFSIASNQLSDLSKVCLPSVRVWGKFSYYFGDPNNVIRNLLEGKYLGSSECLEYRLCMDIILHSNY